jgi:predicted DNA binding CopG/RHH family protein
MMQPKSKAPTTACKKIGKNKTLALPTLDKLAQKENTVKVTLLLSKTSVEYFKNEAKKRDACYQAMVRNLIDEYVTQCSDNNGE